MKPLIALSSAILFALPLISQAQTPSWFTMDDAHRLNTELQKTYANQCEQLLTEGSSEQSPSEATTWKRSLAIRAEGVYGLYNRYTVQFGKKAVSMTLPYRSTWAIDGKTLRPYTQVNDQEVRVGQVGFINVGIQDAVCEIDRAVSIRLEKGSVQSLDAALRRQIKGTMTDDNTLPTVFMQLNGKNAAIIPTATDNSGGFVLRYNRVAVNLPGGNVLIFTDKTGSAPGTIPTDLLRMAASVKL